MSIANVRVIASHSKGSGIFVVSAAVAANCKEIFQCHFPNSFTAHFING